MKHIIAFAGSNSKTSINKQLATYAANLVDNVKAEVLDLNDFDVPLFSVDLETSMDGQPENAHKLLNKIKAADGIIISLAEHNGAYSAVFKNMFDWMSRIESKTFFGKPMLLMATSPGARGGQSVLTIAEDRFPRHNANIVGVFSLPKFKDNFSEGKINDKELNNQLIAELDKFKNAL
ncbi:NADPH-dependent FMN reductase [Mangrovimonas cancribranchiae]|uniref:NAD(P)H-dependent oxidoreductase n=1 Tax=Mangrovimonas cancribranchiae TaxID=3080055 RepID=A0AAU6NZX1_9FLAO